MIYVIEQDLAHYRIPVYDRISQHYSGRMVVFHATPSPRKHLFSANDEDDLPFKHHQLRTFWLAGDRLFFPDIRPVLRAKPRPSVVLLRHSIRDCSKPFLVALLKRWKVPIVIWGQGYSHKRPFQPDRSLRDQLHLRIVRTADTYICYSDEIRDNLSRHVDPRRLFVARNTREVEIFRDLRTGFEHQGKAVLRSELGLRRQHYLCFIGRLMPRKKPLEVLEAFKHLQRTHGLDVGMLMVGHGPLEGKIRKEVAQQAIKDVHIFGALDEHDAARAIFASDVVVVPGWLGLAVAHALALGVPVVSQRVGEGTVGHPPEAASLVDGVTGRWAAPGGPEELAVSISQVLAEKAGYATRAARYADQELSMEKMVAGFVDAIDVAALTRSKELVHH